MIWHRLICPLRTQTWPLASVLGAALAFSAAAAQERPFNQGLPQRNQGATGNSAESGAYAAAVAQADPATRASALQQFLIQYPNTQLRQPAIAQMMQAKREAGDAGPRSQGNGETGGSMGQPMGHAEPMAQPMTQPAPAPAGIPAYAPATAVQPRDSLLQHPAQPAEVAIAPGSLSVKADNSSLSGILDQISKSTGMRVEGLSKDDRIFGSYGPGDPHEVLLSLLEGSGYNVLMVGDNKGTPRQLSLSQRSTSGVAGPASTANTSRQEDDDEIEQEPAPAPPEPPQIQPPQPNGEGAPRNPAEIQQELLRMRQLQQQQQPQ